MQKKINSLKTTIAEIKEHEAKKQDTTAASTTAAVKEPVLLDAKNTEEYKEAAEKIKTYKLKLAHVTKKRKIINLELC